MPARPPFESSRTLTSSPCHQTRFSTILDDNSREGVVDPGHGEEDTMRIHYLEIVTPEVDATCAAYEKLHGVSFSEPDAGLGNARTAALANGGLLGIRAPMHDGEEPVVRPYILVDDIHAAASAAEEAGAEIAHPPMEIPGHGKFAIYIQGGVHQGIWQV
jgi:predicted enzyme related to lactoylglutathione lyase